MTIPNAAVPADSSDSARNAFVTRDLSAWYGEKEAVQKASIAIPSRSITAIIGPSGCGKSTFLRCLNRMHELVVGAHITGEIDFFGENLYAPGVDPASVRRRIGMVFQESNPFPTMTVEENVLVGPRLNGMRDRRLLQERLERSLRMAALWDEVKDSLRLPGIALSGGQQQRLCIARAVAMEPEVLLMDEPCSALDPVATGKIEELIQKLKQRYTIVLVTHNMQQAGRCSDFTAFFYMGRLIEMDRTDRIFTKPAQRQTEDYITGRFG
jgi:phosphate transport system ATP-binding protein